MAERVLVVSAAAMAGHDPGTWHPERADRLAAVLHGVAAADLGDDVLHVDARPATVAELATVHTPAHVALLQRFCERGGGEIDGDTIAVPATWPAALLAAGAGLEAVAHLDRGEAATAFCVVRPPGHHARPAQAMGVCFFNNVAVTARHLSLRGERVLIVDYDVHHGNGTQEIFWDDPAVAYVSMHQWPHWPWTGRIAETGGSGAPGLVANLPFPPGTVGPAYRAAIDEVVVPLAERFRPTWLLLSAGFDAHWTDPLGDILLTAGDFNDITRALVPMVPAGRTIAFLEGGYDRDGLMVSAAACVAALAGVDRRAERASSGDRGMPTVQRAVDALARAVHT